VGTAHSDDIPGYEILIKVKFGTALLTGDDHLSNLLIRLVFLSTIMLPQIKQRGKSIFS
jgi:hypothetical protein